jgi:hypothetical protein
VAINMAHNPTSSIAALYALASGTPPFSPGLVAAPNDWTVALKLAGGSIDTPSAVAIDANGNVWIANTAADTTSRSGSNIAELSSLGTILSGSGGFTSSGTKLPSGVAIDTNGSVWVSTEFGSTKFSNSGSFLLNPSGYSGGGGASGIAVDGVGNAWVSEVNLLPEFTNAGTAAAGSLYQNNGLQSVGVAIDGAGSAWVSDSTGYATVVSRTGVFVSGPNGYLAGGCCFTTLGGIALDSSGEAWLTHDGFPGAIFKLSNSGSNLSGSGGFAGTGINEPVGIAIDGAGMVWISSASSGIEELNASGSVLSGSQGFQPTVSNESGNPAVDGSGNVWLAVAGADKSSSYVVELVGAAAPVITPLAAGLPVTPTADGSSKLGTRP